MLLFSSCTKKYANKQTKSFKFNLPVQIHSLDPLLVRGLAKRFLLFNLHRGLFYYNKDNKLTAHGAKKCKWKSNIELYCELNPKKWSNGDLITSKHYINTYNLIKKEKEESEEFLSNIKKIETINGNLIFYLKRKNIKFMHELTHIYFTPRKEEKLYQKILHQVFSGPYRAIDLTTSKISLANNNYYDDKKRPLVDAIFIDDPNTALNIYNTKRIDFLRYLESSHIPMYPNRYMAPFARLDGIFFNPDHIKDKSLRKALFHSLDYKGLKKIFSSPSLPGCISLPSFFFKTKLACYDLDLKKAKEYLNKVKNVAKKINLYIPNISSNEHKILAQWAKENWKKHLGINLQIKQLETGIFYESILKNKLSVYRKSIILKNLTCVEAIESIKKQPEFKGVRVNSNLSCDKYFKNILKQYIWLPLGMPFFAHLHAKDYSGYYINMLGQFGLENLKKKRNLNL